jgi:hypothetical protein
MNGNAEKEEISTEHEASIARKELQAAELGSKVVVALPLVMAGVAPPPAVADAEALPELSTTSPARAQGLVGMVLPPIELNWAGEAVERYARHVSRALSKTLGCQTEEL